MRRILPVLLVLTGCATTRAIPPAWMDAPVTPRIREVTMDERGGVQVMRNLKMGPIRVELNRLVRDGKPLTPAFAAIDSFDYSASRDEIVFSARREPGGSFDIGLLAGDGSATQWVPADAADEVHVEWAPRGNKISYVVRAKHGDVIRTFHVPTSFQYALDFGVARIHDVGWDPQAERFAVAYSTIDASDRIEIMRYDGTDRRMSRPPDAKIDADVVSFTGDSFALRPLDLRYNERVPVVVWIADDFAWSDARFQLMKNTRAACIVTTAAPDAAFWKLVAETPWLDANRVFIVGAAANRPSNAVMITPDAAIRGLQYSRKDNTVSVAPAAIQSFAAGFIADQLKRTGPPNGSSR